MPARDALQRMWSSLRLVLGALALNMLAAQVAAAVGVDGYTATANFSSGLCFAAALALCCALPTPSLRGRAQRALVRMYDRGEELQAAWSLRSSTTWRHARAQPRQGQLSRAAARGAQ